MSPQSETKAPHNISRLPGRPPPAAQEMAPTELFREPTVRQLRLRTSSCRPTRACSAQGLRAQERAVRKPLRPSGCGQRLEQNRRMQRALCSICAPRAHPCDRHQQLATRVWPSHHTHTHTHMPAQSSWRSYTHLHTHTQTPTCEDSHA